MVAEFQQTERRYNLAVVPASATPQVAACRDNPIAMKILAERYLIKDATGTVIETPEQLFWRVARHVAEGEARYGATPLEVEDKALTYYTIMASGEFLPNTPCLVNAGKAAVLGLTPADGEKYKGVSQLAACFVLGIEDDLISILDTQKYAAMIHKTGGGTGFSFSKLRPEGDIVNSSGGVASGPVSFMLAYDATTFAIKQGGVRRGANMGMLRITHPDVIKFITLKNDLKKLNNFNISVLITEQFMDDVEHDRMHQFINPTTGAVTGIMPARELFDQIVDSAWRTGEPGIVFEDRINTAENRAGWCTNTTPHIGQIQATNPCFTGDTKVWTIDGPKTFKELAEAGQDVQVLTKGPHSELYYEWMRRPHKTGVNQQVMRVTFDDGTSVTCTPNHKFYLTNGGSLEAKELTLGRSISSVYRYKDAKGYLRLNGRPEHRIVARGIYGEIPDSYTVHHKDKNRENNQPDNLELIELGEHMRLHKLGAGNPMYGVWDERNPLYGKSVAGTDNPRYRHDVDDTELQRLRAEGRSYKEIATMVHASKYTVMKRLGWQRRVEIGNHKVAKLEYLDEHADVYNGMVENTHRYFVMCGDDDAILVANCGEQPLLPFETCNLGSINLNKVLRPCGHWGKPLGDSNYELDYTKLRQLARIGTRFLENVVEMNVYPLPQVEEITRKNRRIGLGIMGWADLLFTCNIPYNSNEAVELAGEIIAHITTAAHEESEQLASERGVFENWKGSTLQAKGIVARNCGVTTIAPTGTISILSGASSGIEPLFALTFWRNQADQWMQEVNEGFVTKGKAEGWLTDEILEQVKAHGTCQGITGIPEHIQRVYVTAHDIAPADHLKMQAAWQKWVDSAISKTCNFTNEASRDEIREAYLLAYELGCKGVTVYRDGCRDNQTLQTGASKKQEQAEPEPVQAPEQAMGIYPRPLPAGRLPASRFDVPTPLGNMDMIVTEVEGQPFEVFVGIGRTGSDLHSLLEAIGRLTSILLRVGVPAELVINQLMDIGGRSSIGFGPNRVSSVPDAIAKTLLKHYRESGDAEPLPVLALPEQPEQTAAPAKQSHGEICPGCGNNTLARVEGCKKCSCGYSEC